MQKNIVKTILQGAIIVKKTVMNGMINNYDSAENIRKQKSIFHLIQHLISSNKKERAFARLVVVLKLYRLRW